MTYISERSHIPVVPPGEDELPHTDGEPLETELHRRQMNVSIHTLERAWDDRDDFYVGGNMFIYYSELQVFKNDFRGPDVFVVLDVERRMRKSWVVWKEGANPDVVIELISESTEAVDRGEKKVIYARRMGVPYYFLYDPQSAELEGFRLDLDTKRYAPLSPNERGDLPCDRLKLSLGIRRGSPEGIDGPWLRWIDSDGNPLPTDHEIAEAEVLRAEAEVLRAEAARQHAKAEAQRAEAEAQRAEVARQHAEAEAQCAEVARQHAEAEAQRAEAEAQRAEAADQRAEAADQRADDLAAKLAAYAERFGDLAD